MSTLPPLKARARCRWNRQTTAAAGDRAQVFDFSVAEQACRLTVQGIFDHLVKTRYAHVGERECRPMQDFKNGVPR